MKDLDGRYVYANDTCAKVFRRSVEEVIGKTDAELLPKSAAAKARNVDQQVVAQNKAIETTEYYTRDDGAHYWLTNRFPICAQDGGRQPPAPIHEEKLNDEEIARSQRDAVAGGARTRGHQDLQRGRGQQHPLPDGPHHLPW
jgi:PAS domain-containing protein